MTNNTSSFGSGFRNWPHIVNKAFNLQQSSVWKNYELLLFRFCFIYFFIQAVPLDWKFYQILFSINWFNFSFHELFKLTQYAPHFFTKTQATSWGIAGFADWGIVAIISLAGTIIWSIADRKATNYERLYYWLRVIVRYRLAIGLLGYGFIKLFPLQMPYPSLSNLHTDYGDFLPWKIYWHTIGITQPYESFLGAVEVLAAIGLLYRKTVTFAAALVMGFTGNIVAANFAYSGGEHVYSLYLVVLAVFLFVNDIPRLYNLLALHKTAIASRFHPSFKSKWLSVSRRIIKAGVFVFVIIYGIKTYANYTSAPYLVPATNAINGLPGYYVVSDFRINDKIIPYSLTDTNQWQNVVFEKWATMSIKTSKAIKLDYTNGDNFSEKDIGRTYESAGIGGRLYYSYTADTLHHTIVLQNKNRNYLNEKYTLSYSKPSDSTIILSGTDAQNNTVYAKLDRINKNYMLFEGRRKRVKF